MGSYRLFPFVIIYPCSFPINLAFLHEDIRHLIVRGSIDPELYKFTFSPYLPNLAFAGLISLTGPYFPSIELQARWIAGCFAGKHELPHTREMISDIDNCKNRYSKQNIKYHELVTLFSQEAGVTPDYERYPELADLFLFGPLVPEQFRMNGNWKKSDAQEKYIQICAELNSDVWEKASCTGKDNILEILNGLD